MRVQEFTTRSIGIAAMATATLIVSCGGSTETLKPAAGPATPRGLPPPVDPTPATKLYVAALTPPNEDIGARSVTGRPTFIVDERDGSIRIETHAENLSRGPHAQYFHASLTGEESKCPTNADRDGNRVVDFAELATYAGAPLIALNEDLSQDSDTASDPEIEATEALDYRASTTFSDLASAVRAKHGALPIELDKGVVVLYGVDDSVEVPDNLTIIGDLSRAASVPVACGEVTRVG
jgi:hypothetical protein